MTLPLGVTLPMGVLLPVVEGVMERRWRRDETPRSGTRSFMRVRGASPVGWAEGGVGVRGEFG